MPRAESKNTPDAALIRVCKSALELSQRSDVLWNQADEHPSGSAREVELRDKAYALVAKYHGARERAEDLPATTVAGLVAKAPLALHHLEGASADDQIGFFLATDVLALCSAAERVPA